MNASERRHAISNRITVLRNGELAGTYETERLSRADLITRMMGKAGHFGTIWHGDSVRSEADPTTVGAAFLRAQGLGRQGSIAPCDLEIKTGEILGLAGLLGSGRTELARLLFGLDRAETWSYVSVDCVRESPASFTAPTSEARMGIMPEILWNWMRFWRLSWAGHHYPEESSI